MSQARETNSYAMAGGQFAANAYFGVRDQVYVPDGEAGTERASCFQAEMPREAVQVKRGPATVSRRAAALYLAMLFVVCGCVILCRSSARSAVTKQISLMLVSMESTRKDNAELTLQVTQARDSSRVCYIAVNQLGMVAAEGTQLEYLYVPEIEQFTKAEDNENSNVSAAGELPLLSGQAALTGSR